MHVRHCPLPHLFVDGANMCDCKTPSFESQACTEQTQVVSAGSQEQNKPLLVMPPSLSVELLGFTQSRVPIPSPDLQGAPAPASPWSLRVQHNPCSFFLS